jgi:hypothetical protein
MMAARKSTFAPDMDLDLDAMRAAPGTAVSQAPIHEIPVPAEVKSTPQLKEAAVNMSIYLLPADHKRLRQLAAAEDTSIQSLVMDGIDRVLTGRGQAPVMRWESRRKQR